MTRPELQALVEAVAVEAFGRPFAGRAEWSRRMRVSAGCVQYRRRAAGYPGSASGPPEPVVMRLSWAYYCRYSYDELGNTIKHELCHWFLFADGIAHSHRSRAFRELLRQVGAPRYCRPMERPRKSHRRYRYRCPRCGREWVYRRKVDVACGACFGRYVPQARLRLVQAWSV